MWRLVAITHTNHLAHNQEHGEQIVIVQSELFYMNLLWILTYSPSRPGVQMVSGMLFLESLFYSKLVLAHLLFLSWHHPSESTHWVISFHKNFAASPLELLFLYYSHLCPHFCSRLTRMSFLYQSKEAWLNRSINDQQAFQQERLLSPSSVSWGSQFMVVTKGPG